jgi:hypothetical protein
MVVATYRLFSVRCHNHWYAVRRVACACGTCGNHGVGGVAGSRPQGASRDPGRDPSRAPGREPGRDPGRAMRAAVGPR